MRLLPIVKLAPGSFAQSRSRAVYVTIAHAMVDDDLFAELSTYRWTLHKKRKYPVSKIKGKNIDLHRMVWKLSGREFPQSPMQIDHKDRDQLNNQLTNLRAASRSLQQANRGYGKNNKSGIRGVYQLQNGRWKAKVTANWRTYNLGTFPTKESAAEAYNRAFAEHFPEVDNVNLIPAVAEAATEVRA